MGNRVRGKRPPNSCASVHAEHSSTPSGTAIAAPSHPSPVCHLQPRRTRRTVSATTGAFTGAGERLSANIWMGLSNAINAWYRLSLIWLAYRFILPPTKANLPVHPSTCVNFQSVLSACPTGSLPPAAASVFRNGLTSANGRPLWPSRALRPKCIPIWVLRNTPESTRPVGPV